MRKIRVAIADDSTFIRKALVRILESDGRFEVVGTATCGEELLDHLPAWQPDVISLDLSMPGIGGLRTLDGIMEAQPTPVIILSTHAREDAPLTIEALHRGAVDFIDKQRYSLVDFQSLSKVLVDKILELADPEQVRASERTEPAEPPRKPAHDRTPEATRSRAVVGTASQGPYDLVVIGASTGGPLAIQKVLEDLGNELPVPVVVIQHMPPEFTEAFAERLNNHLALTVCQATNGERLLPGTAYVAPGGQHLTIAKHDGGLVAVLSADPVDATHRPSADVAFLSAAEALGPRALGVLLTGMGRDGASGLNEMSARGAHTVVQDQSSSIVFGMPRAAIELGAAQEVLHLDRIGSRLVELVRAVPREIP